MNKKPVCYFLAIIIASSLITGCGGGASDEAAQKHDSLMKAKVAEFSTVKLAYDVSALTENERQMISLMIEAANIMDDLFWEQTLGGKQAFLDSITNENEKQFAMINYGPWEHLSGNKPFVEGYGEKPPGANYYPADMTKEEFEAWDNPDKTSLYTLIRRDDQGNLQTIWYHDAFREQLTKASDLMKQAATLADDPGLKKYLELRAEALLTSDYQASDFAWMEMKNNRIDFIAGPIENYDDKLFGYKAAFEAFILIKDMEWSQKLDKYIAMLPGLQKDLPVEAKFKAEVPGTSSDLGVYDAVYYAGDCNAGSKTIAINLPNDEEVQLKAGSRRLQLKNSMRAKFDNILLPIASELMDASQTQHIKFDAFFNNVMFHEVGHGLGIKNTINGKGTVREALKEAYTPIEEAKADILGLYIATKLIEAGEIQGLSVEDCFVTYMAGIFRSVRFGAASSHGKANMMCFNFFQDAGAFTINEDGKYKVDFAKTQQAMNDWASMILVMQGTGDYEGARKYIEDHATISPGLQQELDKIKSAGIPVDIVFEQGKDVLGIK
jgi:hypothetical protein